MRGKQIYKLGVFTCSRIIPARAGQTSSRDPPPGFRPEHPRACGANGVAPNTDHMPIGSSPRVRGKHRASGETAAQVQIIPARAGQTLSSFLRMCWDSDHPRACGANASYGYRGGCLRGSSPRVRGKQREGAELRLSGRIIPARAGQTARRSTRRRTSPDHPRACGANAAIGGGVSSLRIIPARAGQTAVRGAWPIARPDHPRARGKPTQHPIGCVAKRIIPARAGQTLG